MKYRKYSSVGDVLRMVTLLMTLSLPSNRVIDSFSDDVTVSVTSVHDRHVTVSHFNTTSFNDG